MMSRIWPNAILQLDEMAVKCSTVGNIANKNVPNTLNKIIMVEMIVAWNCLHSKIEFRKSVTMVNKNNMTNRVADAQSKNVKSDNRRYSTVKAAN